MRATLSFDIDIDRVEDTMGTLVTQEAATLRHAANILDTLAHRPLLEGVTDSLDVVREVVSQLEQYRNMLISFEKAKFETILPQDATATVPLGSTSKPVGEVVKRLRQAQEALKNVGMFDDFVSRIGETDTPSEEGLPDGKSSAEG